MLVQAETAGHRAVLRLHGSREWCRQQARLITDEASQPRWLGIDAGGSPESAIDPARAHRFLGTETDCLVVDCWAGFNPNAFGQLSGTLRGGGILILLTPPLEQWPLFNDPELSAIAVEPYRPDDVGRRFIRRLAEAMKVSGFVCWQEGGALPGLAATSSRNMMRAAEPSADLAWHCRTADQQMAVEAILKAVRRGRRPLVLTADRGRGKSAALGIAAAELIRQGRRIIVTAPGREAVEEVFRFSAGATDPGGQSDCLRFMEPDLALQQTAEGVVLLVDEAAAIPAPVLLRLLQHYSRCIFASTIHGYEGTGRGFAVRFMRQLEQLAPGWQQVRMEQPVRWAEGDPLEAFTFRALMLDAEADEALSDLSVSITRADRDRLAADEPLLRQLFGLLVQAHYRTTPGDLRILLDSPNLHIWLAQNSQQQVLGVLLVAEEGPVDRSLAEAIWQGKRRPTGHLLPQTLIAQEGCIQAAGFRAGRIMRIAVHPQMQRQGLGSEMLLRLKQDAQQMGWDYLGSSFAASPDLIPFWQQNRFVPVRLGQTRDLVSGCHAALVLQGLSEPFLRLQAELGRRFQQQLPLLLTSVYTELEPALVIQLIQHPDPYWQLSDQDRLDLQAFAWHNRMLESCLVPLQKLLLQFAREDQGQALTQQQQWLIRLVLQQQDQQQVFPGQGRKAVMRQLREGVKSLLIE